MIESTRRNEEIVILRKDKKTYREISEKYGISPKRCREIYERHLRRERTGKIIKHYQRPHRDTPLTNEMLQNLIVNCTHDRKLQNIIKRGCDLLLSIRGGSPLTLDLIKRVPTMFWILGDTGKNTAIRVWETLQVF
jgi:hypothetical protein